MVGNLEATEDLCVFDDRLSDVPESPMRAGCRPTSRPPRDLANVSSYIGG